MLHETSAYCDSTTGMADCQILKGKSVAVIKCCLLAESLYQSVFSRVRQVTADDVTVVVLHLVKPPLPAHPGRPNGIPPAAASSAAANDPRYLAASRAAAAARDPRSSTAGSAPAPALAASIQRAAPAPEADVLRTQQGLSGSLPATALQDPAGGASGSQFLKVVTARRASGGAAESSVLPAPLGPGPAVVTDFRTDSAYAQDLRCDPLLVDAVAYLEEQPRDWCSSRGSVVARTRHVKVRADASMRPHRLRSCPKPSVNAAPFLKQAACRAGRRRPTEPRPRLGTPLRLQAC